VFNQNAPRIQPRGAPFLLTLFIAIVIAISLSDGVVHAGTGQTPRDLQYRLVVYGANGAPAGPGTLVRIVNVASGVACAEATTIDGLADVRVVLTSDCPTGTEVRVEVSYAGGAPQLKDVTPKPFEWRASVEGDPLPLTLLVGAPAFVPGPTLPPRAFEDQKLLRYELFVYGRNPSAPAEDGTLVRVYKTTRPLSSTSAVPTPIGPCAEASTVGGVAQIVVLLTSECPEGSLVGITLFPPGELGITANAVPAIEWRAPRTADLQPIDAVVRTVQPRTGGPAEPSTPISPPTTGSGGLLQP
jgi:hypothetical protein